MVDRMASSHTTPFSGSWYPAGRAELEALLDRLFDGSLTRTGPSLLPRPLAFVVPHAGLEYSGTVAASAYRHLRAAKPERIFILGFTHRGDRPGVSIPDIDAFETPLGEITIDRAAAREMASSGQLALVAESTVCDHSVEIQLPLLQKVVAGVPVIPLYVGDLDSTERRAAAQALAQHIRPGDILLASSDMTHYGRSFNYQPFPAGRDVSRRLFDLDSRVIDAAGSLDAELFLDTLHELHSTVCGHAPISLLLETLHALADEDVFQQTLDYQTSADITGDFEHVVSYGSLGYFRADSFRLDEEAQRALLKSARETLQHLSATGERLAIPPAASPLLMRRAPVFVSLHQGRELFGCLGQVTAETPLAEAVPTLTLDAALDDPRFAPRARVPDGIAIEISVLTPMKRIRDWKSFQLGRQGAYLESGSRSGLLLPQVATPGRFTQTSFLETLSRKAGLRPDAYQDPQARLSVFQAQVFGDGG